MTHATIARGRSREGGKKKTKQTSVALEANLYAEMATSIAAREISQRAFIEQAIRNQLAQWRREELSEAYREAFSDAGYAAEMTSLAEAAVGDGIE
jgi:metal-responsive CopG/Arc/MetJ family transcriptional regulator